VGEGQDEGEQGSSTAYGLLTLALSHTGEKELPSAELGKRLNLTPMSAARLTH